jgi:hypothetical protein
MTPRAVPSGLAVFVAAAATACGASTTSPDPSVFPSLALPLVSQTEAYEYRFAAGDTINVEWQEAYHRWAVDALQVSVPRRIRYNKYRNRQHMSETIGVGNTNGFADGDTFEIHTIWQTDNHEVVHLYSSAFGRASALWSEGLAVAFQTDPVAGNLTPRWSGVALDEHARRFRADGRLIPISSLIATNDFRRHDANVTYPQAGSFVRHVLATCGLDGVKRQFASGNPMDGVETVRARFQSVCGTSIEAAEQAWLSALER